MKTPESLRKLTSVAILSLAVLVAQGCGDGDTNLATSPEAQPDTEQAPVLPAPENLSFQLGFFSDNEPSALERASKWNFFNAAVRVFAVTLFTDIVLAPPVGAFALALHTVPSPQPDGSWMWVYTWVNGEEEAQVRLRGKAVSADRVEWSMRVSSTVDGWDQELWFDGETWNDGDGGDWTFYDIEQKSEAEVATLEWGADSEGKYLRLTDLVDNPGDSLEYREEGELDTVTYTDASESELSWYVTWNDVTGAGSLRAPDYNEGEKACWDEQQNDVECPMAPVS